jgi:hypothetical protein
MLRLRFEHLPVFVFMITAALLQAQPVFAGTTGGINGRAVDETSSPAFWPSRLSCRHSRLVVRTMEPNVGWPEL